MIKLIIKFVVGAALLFVGYQAAYFYYLKELVGHISHCYREAGVCEAARRPVTQSVLEPTINQALSCVKKRQSSIGSLLHPVPKADITSTPNEPLSEESRLKLASMCSDFEAK